MTEVVEHIKVLKTWVGSGRNSPKRSGDRLIPGRCRLIFEIFPFFSILALSLHLFWFPSYSLAPLLSPLPCTWLTDGSIQMLNTRLRRIADPITLKQKKAMVTYMQAQTHRCKSRHKLCTKLRPWHSKSNQTSVIFPTPLQHLNFEFSRFRLQVSYSI